MNDPKPRKKGALRWCKRCCRKHGSREGCLQIARSVKTDSGNTATRFVHLSRLQGE